MNVNNSSSESAFYNSATIPELSKDIYTQIFLHLSPDARGTMKKVCHTFNELINYIPLDEENLISFAKFSYYNDASGELVKYLKIQDQFNKSVNSILSHKYDNVPFKDELCRFLCRDAEAINILLKDTRICPDSCNSALRAACVNGSFEVVESLLKDKRVDPAAFDNAPLYWATKQNGEQSKKIIQLLLEHSNVDPAAGNNAALKWACQNGFIEIVRLLLTKNVDPAADKNAALMDACYNGHSDIVVLLLAHKNVDPAADDNAAIKYASKAGHTEVVKILLADERVNPAANNYESLKEAASEWHIEVIKLLLNDSRIDPLKVKKLSILCNRSNLLKLTVLATAALTLGVSIYSTYNNVEEK